MPRLALNYAVTRTLTLRGSVSKGYSPPTTAEIRPSDNNIYRDLEPETGTNLELGARYFSISRRLMADISVYDYRLRHAIVIQQNSMGADYFVNAGSTRQKALECRVSYILYRSVDGRRSISAIQFNSSTTLSRYRFGNYVTAAGDHSGNFITGVPRQVLVNSILFEIKQRGYLFIQHNHTSALPLNDANTVNR